MKLEEIKPDKDNVIRIQEQQIKKKKHTATIIHRPGHTLFECGIAERIIKKAEAKTFYDAGAKAYVTKVLQKENTLYCEALNMKNAKKKFIKMFKAIVGNVENKRVQGTSGKEEQSSSGSKA